MMLQRYSRLLAAGMLTIAALVACSSESSAPEETDEPAGAEEPGKTAEPMPESTQQPGDLPPAAALEAQRALAERLGLSTDEVAIVSTEQMEWSDSCLGLGGPAESCAQVITPGWLVVFEANDQQHEAHTDETGANIRFVEDAPMPIEPETLPLVTQPAPQTDFEEALLTGILEYDENGCWRVAVEGTSFLIIWPQGFTATAMIGAPQVLDTNGEVVGTAGMEISLGGGARENDAAASYEEQHPDLPSDQCPGPYWVVGEIVQP